AERCANRLLEIRPESAHALYLKGAVALRRGDLEAGADWCRKAIAADPGYGEAFKLLGALEWAADKRDVGFDLLERAFILTPESADVADAYHSAVTAMKAWERAARVLNDACGLHPAHKQLSYRLIEALLRLGRQAEAMERIEEVMLSFGIDQGILAAALEVRGQIGPYQGLASGSNRGSLSLCMIVRTEERTLARCLARAKPAVSEIIVVDTGSLDRTREIATAYGAKVFEHPWADDFSAARNFALANATSEWILVLDADEVIAAHELAAVAALASGAGSKLKSWSFVTRNYVAAVNTSGWTANDGSYALDEAGTGWIPSVKVRLFPNRADIRFSDPVHERVEPALEKLGIPVKAAAIPVHHYGKLDERADRGKGESYYELGKRKLDELGDDVTAIAELAIQARALERYDEAIELWQRALAISPDLSIAWFNVGSALIELGRYEEALTASRRALELKPEQKEIVYNCAMAEFYAGDGRSALEMLERLTGAEPEYPVAAALLAATLAAHGRP
ncbi:MAG: glycosyltransferase, partial [Candidatus Eiseniibacteriota bacterium]